MASLSLDVTDFFLLGALNVYPVPAAMSPEAAERSSTRCWTTSAGCEGKFDVIFIDSLTSFVSQVPEAHTLPFLTTSRSSATGT